MNRLVLRGLGCIKGERELFRGLDAEVIAGQMLRIEGENGSGKTTLLRLICGLFYPDAGEVTWNGCDIHQGADAYHSDLLYVGHQPGIKDDLTPLENLELAAYLGVGSAQLSPVTALARLGLAAQAQTLCRHLSSGQRRRVALARLLTRRAPLWVLDEPLTALDYQGVALMIDLLREHLAGGGIAVLTSHQVLPADLPGVTVQLKSEAYA